MECQNSSGAKHRACTNNVINRFIPLVVECLEPLNEFRVGLYGEFERFDRLDVVTRLSCCAMTGRAKRSRRDAERRVESSDESKIGR